MNHRDQKKTCRRHGSSLVEVVMAMVILVLMVIAVGAYLIHVQATVAIQGNKRIAFEVASARLEAVRADRYERILPLAEDFQTYFIAGSPGAWSVSSSDPGETVTIHGLERSMRTTVQYIDVDGGGNSYDGVRVQVEVSYRSDQNAHVQVDTLVSPLH